MWVCDCVCLHVQGDSVTFCHENEVPFKSRPAIEIGETETFDQHPDNRGELRTSAKGVTL